MFGEIYSRFNLFYLLIKSLILGINLLTAGATYIRFLHFLLAHYIPPFIHVKDKMCHQSATFVIC